jgi:hypothetical protein
MNMTDEIKTPPPPNGHWPKGTSGNPAGRPRGSRNKATLALEALLEGDAEQLIQKAKTMALDGNVGALRLCLDRVMPPPKERRIELDLPSIKNAQQVSQAMSTIFRAIAEGQITPGEGEMLAKIISAQMQILGAADAESRFEKVERAIAELNVKLNSTESHNDHA